VNAVRRSQSATGCDEASSFFDLPPTLRKILLHIILRLFFFLLALINNKGCSTFLQGPLPLILIEQWKRSCWMRV
jgi:hypothetical protein